MTTAKGNAMSSQAHLAKAIDNEAGDWAAFFKVTDAAQIEARRNVMRANVAVGFIEPLRPYLESLSSQSSKSELPT